MATRLAMLGIIMGRKDFHYVRIPKGTKIPDDLDVIQVGAQWHYVIVPRQRMPLNTYRTLLEEIVADKSVMKASADVGDDFTFDPADYAQLSPSMRSLARALHWRLWSTAFSSDADRTAVALLLTSLSTGKLCDINALADSKRAECLTLLAQYSAELLAEQQALLANDDGGGYAIGHLRFGVISALDEFRGGSESDEDMSIDKR